MRSINASLMSNLQELGSLLYCMPTMVSLSFQTIAPKFAERTKKKSLFF